MELKTFDQDPVIMYIIVRESLNMSIGKTCAQVGHAVMMLQIDYEQECRRLPDKFDHAPPDQAHKVLERELKCSTYDLWLNTSYRKVVLKADEKEFDKLLNEISLMKVVVIDNGLTEIAANTNTVIGLWPMHKSEAPKIIKKLQLLK